MASCGTTVHSSDSDWGNGTPHLKNYIYIYISGIPRGGLVAFNPPPQIPKALQNRAKLNPITKTVKNC